MANKVKKSNLTQSAMLCQIIWRAGLIPCLVCESGVGKSALIRMLAIALGFVEWRGEADKPNKKGELPKVYWEAALGYKQPEDLLGVPSPQHLAGEQPRTVFGIAEEVHEMVRRECLVALDELDRAGDAMLAALCAGLARTPAVIGGHQVHPETRFVAAINGETDDGTVELPEAIRQRMVFLYLDVSDEEYADYLSAEHGLHPHGAYMLATQLRKMSPTWTPTDLAGMAKRYNRSNDRMLAMARELADLVSDGVVEDAEAPAMLEALAHGQCGAPYWANSAIRDLVQSKYDYWRLGLDENAILAEPDSPETATPPTGYGHAIARAFSLLTNAVIPERYSSRLSDEDKEAMATE